MSDDDFERGLEAFRQAFRESLPERMAQLTATWSKIEAGQGAEADYEALERGLHSLAGSGRTFDVAGLSEAASAAEAYLAGLRRGGSPTQAERQHFRRLLGAVAGATSTP